MANREPLTAEHCDLIWHVCECEPHGLVPYPDALPVAVSLIDRGNLTKEIKDDRIVLHVSDEFRNAAVLNAAMDAGSTLN